MTRIILLFGFIFHQWMHFFFQIFKIWEKKCIHWQKDLYLFCSIFYSAPHSFVQLHIGCTSFSDLKKSPGKRTASMGRWLLIKINGESGFQVRNFLDGKASDVDVQSMRHLQQIFRQFRKVASEMEKDMMASIRNQYFLIDRSDADTIGMLQKVRFSNKT